MKTPNLFKWQTAVAVLGGLVVSLVFLILAENLDAQKIHPAWLKPLIENIGTTIMVATTVGLMFEVMTRVEIMNLINETKTTIAKQIGTLRSLEEIGLTYVHPDTYTYPWKDIILASRDLTIVLNDGKSWLSRHSEFIKTRMQIPGFKTTFIFQHPDSKMIEVLSGKMGQSPEFLIEKVKDTVKELLSYSRIENHQLLILGHHYFNPYSLFITEDCAVMCPYYISPNLSIVPSFYFERRGQTSQYNRYNEDIQHLIRDSQPLVI
jgi:hypothetical protein